MAMVIEAHHLPGVLSIRPPAAGELPLVFDSPHSGTDYPADFRPVAPMAELRRAQDTHVERLFGAAPDHGAVLLEALFPRVYVDPNRSLDDLDPELLAAPWPVPLAPSEKSRRGLGLIWRLCPPGRRVIYDRALPVAEVEGRIERYWRPYHGALSGILDRLHHRFGQVWHVNCHSMNSVSTTMHAEGPGMARPDFVIGDRDGTTCSVAFTALVREHLEAAGHSVAVNDPYKGVELVRAYSAPQADRHSLQIEIARRLYMNEDTLEPNDGFAPTKALLSGLIAALADFVRTRLG
jgi:N-formylglutamate deformylase